MTAPGAGPAVVVLVSSGTEWRAVRKMFPVAEGEPSPLSEWFAARLEGGEASRLEGGAASRLEGGAAARLEGGAVPRPVIFFHGGWGKIAAAASTQYVIDRWSPALLVNLGTCGGFEGEVERGAILLAERTLVYDIVEQIGDTAAAIARYTTEIDLSWLHEPYPDEVRRSLLVSADRDLRAEDLPQLRASYGAVAGDWESGAIAYVAARNGTPALILRGVSDLVGEGGGEAYGNFQLYAEAAGEIMGRLVEMLPRWIDRGLPAQSES